MNLFKIDLHFLRRAVTHFWFAPLLSLTAALDALIIVIPMDGILISSTMLVPKRWLLFGLSVAAGSCFGALIIASLAQAHGMSWILHYYPDIQHSQSWIWTLRFFDRYGLIFLFFFAMSPFVQMPAVILASLAQTPLLELGVVLFLGRAIKFCLVTYLSTHATGWLTRFWPRKLK